MQNTDKLKILVCPKCKTKLSSQLPTELFCKKCEIKFPLISGNIVPFFLRPDNAIASAYFSLYQAVKGWENRAATLTKTLKTSKRKKQLLPMLKALHDNKTFFKTWMEKIKHAVKPDMLIEIVRQNSNSNYGYNYSYLGRDWSDEKPQELAHMLGAINKALADHNPKGNACFLGIGTGRLACELADNFDEVWGIDASLGQVAQFNTVLEQTIDFWQINTKNSVHSKNMLEKLSATIEPDMKDKAQNINYIWADTLNSPFADDFFDWVISIYFSDVKPLPDLISEVKRLLNPGGYFLHFGPLEYHFPKIEHHYAYDEFIQYFIENGFEIIYDTTAIPASDKVDDKLLTIPQRYIEKVLLLRLVKN